MEVNRNSLVSNLAMISTNQWKLYRGALKVSNLQLASTILMQIAKLNGLLNQPIHCVVEGKRELDHLSDEELEVRIAAFHNRE